MKATKSKIKEISVSALFAALICVASPFVVPIGAVPLSLANFAVMLCAFTLPTVSAVSAVAVYLLLGLCGVPVFSSFQGGAHILLGATGGFLWGYIFLCLFCSFVPKNKQVNLKTVLLCTLGLLCVYALGTLQYCLVCKVNILSALIVCVLPFILFDIIKCILAYLLSKRLKKAIKI